MRQLFKSGAKWEDIVGYSRAVRVGNVIEVTGTTSTEGHEIKFEGDVYNQTRFIISKLEKVLNEAGARLEDTVRTRIYVVNIDLWEEVGKAHKEYFNGIEPATSMIEVSRLIDDRLLVEIELTAIVE